MTKIRDKSESSRKENILIREYFNDQKNGYFVEIARNNSRNPRTAILKKIKI